MRRLEVDLEQATGLALADFDVLAQLASAGGELRMTELAARALISRSGMTRRVARLVDEGLVRRANADADARGVVVALTDAGIARLTETAPVHLRESRNSSSPSSMIASWPLSRRLSTRSSSTARSAERAARPNSGGFLTPTDREIHVERVFDAPRERVFAVFNDPELIPEWWGPATTVDQMDVRPGGSWRYVARNPDGTETGFRGTYREVTAPERIVRTFEWEGMPGHVLVETVVFEDLGDRTKVTTTMLFDTTEERDGMLASGMERGVNETYARLDELLARLTSN